MYFNIAYLTEDQNDCRCVLNKAGSAEEAKENFQKRSPGLKVVSVWERLDFVPVESDKRPKKGITVGIYCDNLEAIRAQLKRVIEATEALDKEYETLKNLKIEVGAKRTEG